jgi:hypothetical protein
MPATAKARLPERRCARFESARAETIVVWAFTWRIRKNVPIVPQSGIAAHIHKHHIIFLFPVSQNAGRKRGGSGA